MQKIKTSIGILGALAVVLGAFGAHGIKPHLSEAAYGNFQTAVFYHFVHTLALGLIVLSPDSISERGKKIAFYAFTSGIICFSGSLYLLSTREITGIEALKFLGPITPVGGLLFVAGWLSLLLKEGGKTPL